MEHRILISGSTMYDRSLSAGEKRCIAKQPESQQPPEGRVIEGAKNDRNLHDTVLKNIEHFRKESQPFLEHAFVDDLAKKEIDKGLFDLTKELVAGIGENQEQLLANHRDYEAAMRKIEGILAKTEDDLDGTEGLEGKRYSERMLEKWNERALAEGSLLAPGFGPEDTRTYVLDIPENWTTPLEAGANRYDISQSRHRIEFTDDDVKAGAVFFNIPGIGDVRGVVTKERGNVRFTLEMPKAAKREAGPSDAAKVERTPASGPDVLRSRTDEPALEPTAEPLDIKRSKKIDKRRRKDKPVISADAAAPERTPSAPAQIDATAAELPEEELTYDEALGRVQAKLDALTGYIADLPPVADSANAAGIMRLTETYRDDLQAEIATMLTKTPGGMGELFQKYIAETFPVNVSFNGIDYQVVYDGDVKIVDAPKPVNTNVEQTAERADALANDGERQLLEGRDFLRDIRDGSFALDEEGRNRIEGQISTMRGIAAELGNAEVALVLEEEGERIAGDLLRVAADLESELQEIGETLESSELRQSDPADLEGEPGNQFNVPAEGLEPTPEASAQSPEGTELTPEDLKEIESALTEMQNEIEKSDMPAEEKAVLLSAIEGLRALKDKPELAQVLRDIGAFIVAYGAETDPAKKREIVQKMIAKLKKNVPESDANASPEQTPSASIEEGKEKQSEDFNALAEAANKELEAFDPNGLEEKVVQEKIGRIMMKYGVSIEDRHDKLVAVAPGTQFEMLLNKLMGIFLTFSSKADKSEAGKKRREKKEDEQKEEGEGAEQKEINEYVETDEYKKGSAYLDSVPSMYKEGDSWHFDADGAEDYRFTFDKTSNTWNWQYEEDATPHDLSTFPVDKWPGDATLKENEVPVPESYRSGMDVWMTDLNDKGVSQVRAIIAKLGEKVAPPEDVPSGLPLERIAKLALMDGISKVQGKDEWIHDLYMDNDLQIRYNQENGKWECKLEDDPEWMVAGDESQLVFSAGAPIEAWVNDDSVKGIVNQLKTWNNEPYQPASSI